MFFKPRQTKPQLNQVQDTLLIIKPETIKRRLVGKIFQTFEDAGFEIVALKMEQPSESLLKRHYPGSKKWRISVGNKVISTFNSQYDVQDVIGTTDAFKIGSNILQWSIHELTNGPVIIIVLRGVAAVNKVKKLVGETEPAKAEVGTLRSSFSQDTIINSYTNNRPIYNVVHRSSSVKEARHEISVWFKPSELV